MVVLQEPMLLPTAPRVIACAADPFELEHYYTQRLLVFWVYIVLTTKAVCTLVHNPL